MPATEETERREPFAPDLPLAEPTPPAWLKKLNTPGLILHSQKGETEQVEAALELLRRGVRKVNRLLTDRERAEERAALRDLDE